MVNWLAGDDDLISIQPKPLRDVNVIIPDGGWSKLVVLVIFFGFFLGLPLILLITGIVIWWKRRKA